MPGITCWKDQYTSEQIKVLRAKATQLFDHYADIMEINIWPFYIVKCLTQSTCLNSWMLRDTSVTFYSQNDPHKNNFQLKKLKKQTVGNYKIKHVQDCMGLPGGLKQPADVLQNIHRQPERWNRRFREVSHALPQVERSQGNPTFLSPGPHFIFLHSENKQGRDIFDWLQALFGNQSVC